MAANASSNFLLGSSHYHRYPSSYRHQNSIGHDNGDLEFFHRRGSSAQSLQAIFSISKSSTSPFETTVTYSAKKTPSVSAISTSIDKDPTSYGSLVDLNHVSFNSNKNQSQEIPLKKNSDEKTDSSHLSNNTQLFPLESTNNEKRPPIEVRVRCVFLRVGEIDTLNERYTSEIFFEASWFAADPKCDPPVDHFNPQVAVLNHIGDSLRHDKWYSMKKTNEEGVVEITEHHKFKGVFWERMELNHFPYDVQELSISLTTPLTTNDFYFAENKLRPSGVNRTVFSDEQSWDLYEHVEFQFTEQREEYSLNFDQTHPVVSCTCHVGRKCGYYIWNAYFLIFLITSASLCTFAIPPSNSHGRLQITCTLLLTSVTFRWVVNKSLPTISYLTALDLYAIASIVALCIINVFHGLISYIYYNQIYLAAFQTPTSSNALHLSLYPDYALCRLDRLGFYILSILFCLYQILILIWSFWTPYQRRRSMKQKDEKNRAELIQIIESTDTSRVK